MKRYVAILGTRPEAIKLAPVILAALKSKDVDIEVCAKGQHKEMLEQTLHAFDVSV